MRPTRQASSQVSWSLLTEGVTQARVDAHRLRLMVDRVMALVESSSEKDHLWQVGGDLIQGFPERLGELERALDRTSYALVVMGEDFLRGRIPMDDRYVVDEATKSHPYAEPRKKDTAAARVARRYLQSQAEEVPRSAEHYFFDNPKRRETREFAESDALSNFPGIAAKSVKEMDNSTLSVSQARSDARQAPPTPTEIKKKPGGEQFSTLNRLVMETEEAEVPKAVARRTVENAPMSGKVAHRVR